MHLEDVRESRKRVKTETGSLSVPATAPSGPPSSDPRANGAVADQARSYTGVKPVSERGASSAVKLEIAHRAAGLSFAEPIVVD